MTLVEYRHSDEPHFPYAKCPQRGIALAAAITARRAESHHRCCRDQRRLSLKIYHKTTFSFMSKHIIIISHGKDFFKSFYKRNRFRCKFGSICIDTRG